MLFASVDPDDSGARTIFLVPLPRRTFRFFLFVHIHPDQSADQQQY